MRSSDRPPRAPAGSVAARKVRVVLAVAERAGLPRGPLLGRIGLTEEQVADPDAWVPHAAWARVWDAVAEATGDPAIGLRAAAAIEPGYFGVIDYAARACRDVREALPLAARFFRLANSWGRIDVAPTTTGVCVSRHILGDEAMVLPRQAADFALATMVRVFRLAVARPLPLLRVTFRHAPPADPSPWTSWFACPVSFGERRDAVELPHAALDVPMRAPDPALRALVEAHASGLLERIGPPEADLVLRTRQQIAQRLGDHPGAPLDVDAVARALGMSGRTLQRRLGEEGTTFRALVDALRSELARTWLRQGHSPGEVAFLLGYGAVPAFHRAFVGWTGTTPGQFAAGART